MREREVKLSVAREFDVPDLGDPAAGIVAEPAPTRELRTAYYDTADLRLARWGASLRYRTGEGWTVKLAGESSGPLVSREEVVFEGPPGQPPGDAVDLVRAFVRGAQLAPAARLRVTRRPMELRDGDARRLGELTDDQVAVLDGRKVSRRFREIEVELAPDVPEGALDPVVKRLQDAGAEPVKVKSKYLQALGTTDPGPPEVVLESLKGRATVDELVRYDLGAAVLRLMRHDPVVRLDKDPEGVHQARVATRRFRSSLRTFRPVLDEGWTVRLRERAKWLADRLGAVRDADVLLARLESRLAELPEADARAASWLLQRLHRERGVARSALLAVMREDAYVRLLDDLLDAAHEPKVLEGELPADATLVPQVATTWRRLRKEVRQAGAEPSDAQLHRIRIRAKRSRYAAEALVPVVGKPAEAYAEACERIQEILGDHHDAVVAQDWLRRAAGARGAPGQAAMAAGQLIAVERDVAARRRGEWEDAWAALDRKKLRSWL